MASLRPKTDDPAGRSIGHALSAPLAALGQTVDTLRARGSKSLGLLGLSVALLLGGMVAGVLLSTRWQPQTAGILQADSPITRQSEREIVASTIGRLESEQADLKKQIADLRGRINDFEGSSAQRKSTLQDTSKELEKQRIASGMLPLHGPGVVATFDDSTTSTIPENEDPAKYIIHDYDLRDVLNTLWVAGAEAISVNGERIVSNTSLYCVGTTIIVNATRLSPPYEVRAIGDPETLEVALHGSTQMEKFNQRAMIYDLPVRIAVSNDLPVTGYNGSLVSKYAEVGK
ncbi:MAG: DUF881 domain-containing protein [Chloroflexota bacterium]